MIPKVPSIHKIAWDNSIDAYASSMMSGRKLNMGIDAAANRISNWRTINTSSADRRNAETDGLIDLRINSTDDSITLVAEKKFYERCPTKLRKFQIQGCNTRSNVTN